MSVLTYEKLRDLMREFSPAPRTAGPLQWARPSTWNGLDVTTSPYLDRFVMGPNQQFRFPRSRRGRIRKKWARRPSNWRRLPKKPLEVLIYQTPAGLLMHPETWRSLQLRLASR